MPTPFAWRHSAVTRTFWVKRTDREVDGGTSLLGLPGRGKPSKLEIAADNAHRLTEMLRKKGIEAYEFHDRFESIVTIGSFDTVGNELPDGRIDLQPQIHQIMQTYGAERSPLPNQGQACVLDRSTEYPSTSNHCRSSCRAARFPPTMRPAIKPFDETPPFGF